MTCFTIEHKEKGKEEVIKAPLVKTCLKLEAKRYSSKDKHGEESGAGQIGSLA